MRFEDVVEYNEAASARLSVEGAELSNTFRLLQREFVTRSEGYSKRMREINRIANQMSKANSVIEKSKEISSEQVFTIQTGQSKTTALDANLDKVKDANATKIALLQMLLTVVSMSVITLSTIVSWAIRITTHILSKVRTRSGGEESAKRALEHDQTMLHGDGLEWPTSNR